MSTKKSALQLEEAKEKLAVLKKSFSDWRANRRKDDTIPTKLWEEASLLVPYFSKSILCFSLGISNRQFSTYLDPAPKKNVSKNNGAPLPDKSTPIFVELPIKEKHNNDTSCIIIKHSNGMTMMLESINANDALQLAKDFIRK